MIVSCDPEKPRRLQKRHLVPPDRWTAEQPEFLGFSFPSCSTPVLGPTTDPSEGHGRTRDPELQMIRQDLNTYRFGARHAGVWELFDDPGAYYKPEYAYPETPSYIPAAWPFANPCPFFCAAK